MQKTLGTSGPESMAAAANVLVGHTEAPLVIRPYVEKMTRSELNALMVGGFATISGSLMAIFVFYGISAGHLLTASIISAPAALVIAKVLQPETETPAEVASVSMAPEQVATNVIEAAAIGASASSSDGRGRSFGKRPKSGARGAPSSSAISSSRAPNALLEGSMLWPPPYVLRRVR